MTFYRSTSQFQVGAGQQAGTCPSCFPEAPFAGGAASEGRYGCRGEAVDTQLLKAVTIVDCYLHLLSGAPPSGSERGQAAGTAGITELVNGKKAGRTRCLLFGTETQPAIVVGLWGHWPGLNGSTGLAPKIQAHTPMSGGGSGASYTGSMAGRGLGRSGRQERESLDQ